MISLLFPFYVEERFRDEVVSFSFVSGYMLSVPRTLISCS